MTRYTPTMTPQEIAFWTQRQARAQRLVPLYQDKEMECGFCGRSFLWTAERQREFTQNTRQGLDPGRPPMCSKACAGKRVLARIHAARKVERVR